MKAHCSVARRRVYYSSGSSFVLARRAAAPVFSSSRSFPPKGFHCCSHCTPTSDAGGPTHPLHKFKAPTRSFAAPATDDLYDRYRGPPTAELLSELRLESQTTLQSLPRGLYQRMHHEIGRAAAWNEQVVQRERSLGPTGRFLYGWAVEEDDAEKARSSTTTTAAIPRRPIYQRWSVVDGGPHTAQRVLEMDLQHPAGTDLIAMSLSVDEHLLAYLVVAAGSGGPSQIWIRDITTGATVQLNGGVPNAERAVMVEFGAKKREAIDEAEPGAGISHSLFYVSTDSLGRPDRVYGTTIHPKSLFRDDIDNPPSTTTTATPSTARMVLHSSDPSVHLDIQRTKGCQFVAIQCRTQSSNEVYLLEHSDNRPQLVRRRVEGIQYHVDVGKAQDIFVLANRQSNGDVLNDELDPVGTEPTLFQCSIRDLPLQKTWGKVLTPAVSNFAVADYEIYLDNIALCERSVLNGMQRIRLVHRRIQGEEWTVPIPQYLEPLAMLSLGGNMHYESKSIQFHMECPTTPRRTFECNMMTRELLALNAPVEVSSGRGFEQRRVAVVSKDGTLVPLSIIHRKDVATANDGENEAVNAVLLGYGAYGQPLNLAFNPSLQPLLDRGFVLAFAHTRGGGELGRSWHLKGRGRNKLRAIEDFVACAEALVSGTVLNRSVHLSAKAFSAGGVLLGAAVNQRPELFRRVVFTNAFLDVNATLRNRSLHLTEHEWPEYGNPLDDETAAETVASYCPTLNASGSKSSDNPPKFLVIGTLDDDRVPFWNAVVYAKKMREEYGDKSNVLLHIEAEGGHHLGHNRLRVAAMETTFLAGNAA